MWNFSPTFFLAVLKFFSGTMNEPFIINGFLFALNGKRFWHKREEYAFCIVCRCIKYFEGFLGRTYGFTWKRVVTISWMVLFSLGDQQNWLDAGTCSPLHWCKVYWLNFWLTNLLITYWYSDMISGSDEFFTFAFVI